MTEKRDRGGSRGRGGDGPAPEGPWMAMGCAGPKLENFERGGEPFSFQEGMDMCFEKAKSGGYPGDMPLCCRCDRGDGEKMTDRCWLQEGGMEPDKDFAFMV